MGRNAKVGALLFLAGLSLGRCSRSASPLEPVARDLLALWKTADLVCLGEEHGSRLDSDLRVRLIEQPAFAATVDRIVVEFANPIHQATLDRLVLDGEDLRRDELRPVWFDAGGGEFWDSPVYETFLRAVARANRDRPHEEKVAVVGGALPIDWSRIQEARDLLPFIDRRAHFASVSHRALEMGGKTLAIYGSGHCERDGMGFLGDLDPADRRRIRSVYRFDAAYEPTGARRLELGSEPALVQILGTPRAALPATGVLSSGARPGTRIGDLVDYVIHPGSLPAALVLPPPDALTAAETAELERRRLLWMQARSIQ